MANYGINIDVKIKAGKLTNFNRVLDQTNEKIDKANNIIYLDIPDGLLEII